MRATFAGLTHAIRNLMMAVFAIICHPYFLRTASNGAPLGRHSPFKALQGRQKSCLLFFKERSSLSHSPSHPNAFERRAKPKEIII